MGLDQDFLKVLTDALKLGICLCWTWVNWRSWRDILRTSLTMTMRRRTYMNDPGGQWPWNNETTFCFGMKKQYNIIFLLGNSIVDLTLKITNSLSQKSKSYDFFSNTSSVSNWWNTCLVHSNSSKSHKRRFWKSRSST